VKRPVRLPQALKMDSAKAQVEPCWRLSHARRQMTTASSCLALRARHVHHAELLQGSPELEQLDRRQHSWQTATSAHLQPVRQLGEGGGSVMPGRAVVVRDEGGKCVTRVLVVSGSSHGSRREQLPTG